MMWLAKLLMLILSLGNFVLAQDNYYPISAKRSQYCGKKLADVLNLVCGGEYNGPDMLGKKSDPGYSNMLDWTKTEWEDIEDSQDYPLQRSVGRYLIPNAQRIFRRHVRGIVEECCVRPCTYNVLRMYCKLKPGEEK